MWTYNRLNLQTLGSQLVCAISKSHDVNACGPDGSMHGMCIAISPKGYHHTCVLQWGTEGLFTWFINHAIVARSSKICDWLLNLFQDHSLWFTSHYIKQCKSDDGTSGFQKVGYQAYAIHCRGPMGLQWEKQKRFPHCKRLGTMTEKCRYERERERYLWGEKRTKRVEGEPWRKFPKLPILTYVKNIYTTAF